MPDNIRKPVIWKWKHGRVLVIWHISFWN